MEVQLTSRLLTAVSMLHPGNRVADVGTDHGYAAVYLVKKGLCPYVIASDIRKGPLDSAARTCREYGAEDRVELRLSDGLQDIQPEEVDEILIAGLGGETIRQILQSSPWAMQKFMVLQPQSKENELLTFLQRNGCAVTPGLAREGKRYYLLFAVVPGKWQKSSLAELLSDSKDTLLAGYAHQEAEKYRRAEAGAREGKNPAAAVTLQAQIRQWEKTEEEAKLYDNGS